MDAGLLFPFLLGFRLGLLMMLCLETWRTRNDIKYGGLNSNAERHDKYGMFVCLLKAYVENERTILGNSIGEITSS